MNIFFSLIQICSANKFDMRCNILFSFLINIVLHHAHLSRHFIEHACSVKYLDRSDSDIVIKLN